MTERDGRNMRIIAATERLCKQREETLRRKATPEEEKQTKELKKMFAEGRIGYRSYSE